MVQRGTLECYQSILEYVTSRCHGKQAFSFGHRRSNYVTFPLQTLGNHEFDHGVEGVVPFIESINSPMLVANMDSTNEPTLTGLYENSTILVRNNRKIGVIGVILETTYVSFSIPYRVCLFVLTNLKILPGSCQYR